ncbi:uncharacterized protein [Narcine bancroftii]|uniref:uncharacterized protein isoform X4 n=1 Tax=Narcine bancroftii TaxID=1343680 RepID=UPI003831F175
MPFPHGCPAAIQAGPVRHEDVRHFGAAIHTSCDKASPTARRSLPPLLPSYSSELLDPSPLLPVLTISSRPSLDPLIDALNPTPLDRPPHHATWLPNCRWSPGTPPIKTHNLPISKIQAGDLHNLK